MTTKQFEALSPAEQRVAIAKDIIKQIKAEKYIAIEGLYVSVKTPNEEGAKSTDVLPVKENLKNVTCHVCALGATVLSIARFKNTITFGEVITTASNFSENADRLLKSIFTTEQLALLEAAFEGAGGNNYTKEREGYNLPQEENTRADAFYHAEYNSNSRLVAIMQNIIANNGELILPEAEEDEEFGNEY